MFGEALAEVVSASDVCFVGMSFATKDVDVERRSPPSLA